MVAMRAICANSGRGVLLLLILILLDAEKDVFKRYRLSYAEPVNIPTDPHIAVFFHAAVGIFKKKRWPNETWGYGGEILNELLNTSLSSGLLKQAARTYVTALGARTDVAKVEKSLKMNYPGVSMIISGADLYVAEFPSLLAIFEYAKKTHDDSLIVYMHTKGTGKGNYNPADTLFI